MRTITQTCQRHKPVHILTNHVVKAGFALALGAAMLSTSSAWAAGSWNSQNMSPNSRTYPSWTYTPGSVMSNGKHALAVILHGCAQNQNDLQSWGNLMPAAENKGVVLFVPGVGNNYWTGNSSAACWNYDGAKDGSHNIADVINMTQSLLNNSALNIDSNHVYILGLSSGAAMALDIACSAPDIFAGVSSLAGPSVGSSQFSALVDQSGIMSSNVPNALSACKNLAGSKASYFASQIANLAYGDKDKNGENPGCSYTSGSTNCPGQYQLVSKKWATDNVSMYQQLYGAGSLGTAANVYNNTGTTATAAVNGAMRISLTRVFNVGHAWPAGSGQANDASKGGVWIAQSGMNFSDYMLSWLMNSNVRASGGGITSSTATTTTTTTTTTATTTTTTATAGACYNASNYSHVTAGRAHDSGGYAYANGSNQTMGLDNLFYTTKLRQTGSNYYVIDSTCP